jgi:hypothetical protein
MTNAHAPMYMTLRCFTCPKTKRLERASKALSTVCKDRALCFSFRHTYWMYAELIAIRKHVPADTLEKLPKIQGNK